MNLHKLFGVRLSFVLVTGLFLSGGVTRSLWAQAPQADLRGTVVDESGAVVPGATVTAVHLATGTSRSTTTTETGTYRMPALPVGNYRVTVELGGFTPLVRESLSLQVGQEVEIDFTLRLGAMAEAVQVTGEVPLIETRKTTLGGRLSPDQVQGLPISGRNFLELASLAPGARGYQGEIVGGTGVGESSGDMTLFQVDGVDVSNQCCRGTNLQYSLEAVAEFEVITNRFDASAGRSTGSIINIVSKSGSNQFHATGFGFFRDDRFNAASKFTGRVEPFSERQTGISGGGPIKRDKAHFFMVYENQKRVASATPGTGIPQFDVTVPSNSPRNYVHPRVDWQIAPGHNFFSRVGIFRWSRLYQGVGGRHDDERRPPFLLEQRGCRHGLYVGGQQSNGGGIARRSEQDRQQLRIAVRYAAVCLSVSHHRPRDEHSPGTGKRTTSR